MRRWAQKVDLKTAWLIMTLAPTESGKRISAPTESGKRISAPKEIGKRASLWSVVMEEWGLNCGEEVWELVHLECWGD